MHGKYITMSISLSVMYIQNNMVLHFQFSFESSSYRENLCFNNPKTFIKAFFWNRAQHVGGIATTYITSLSMICIDPKRLNPYSYTFLHRLPVERSVVVIIVLMYYMVCAGDHLKINEQHLFLAHLSTKCSWWAIVTGLCPSSVVVHRPSCVVRRPSCVERKLFYLNIFSSATTHWILTKLHRNDPWVVPYQSCSNGFDWLYK